MESFGALWIAIDASVVALVVSCNGVAVAVKAWKRLVEEQNDSDAAQEP